MQKCASFTWGRASLALACAAALCRLVCAAAGPPVITLFSPHSGPEGVSILILGENLGDAIEVNFNGVPAQFESGTFIDGSLMLLASVPATATTGPISVTTGQGTSSSATSFIVIDGKPVIEGFSPASGPPGSDVVISGQNLKYITSVLFNGQTCDRWGLEWNR